MGGAKDHHVARAPPPTDALSPMESLDAILHQRCQSTLDTAARCKEIWRRFTYYVL